MTDARTTLEHRLAKGDLQGVIAAGMALTAHGELPALREGITLLSARYEQLLREQGDGTISRDEARIERARIGKALLDWLRGLPTGLSLPPEIGRSHTGQGSGWLRGLLVAGLVLVALAGGVVWWKKQQVRQHTRSNNETEVFTPNPKNTTDGRRPAQDPAPAKKAKKEADPKIDTPNAPQTVLDKVYATKEGMQRGLYQGRLAFCNLKTGKILCCFEDAEDFRDGRAYVKADGAYFYIDKSGRRSEE